jgi:hypothetical protein
MTYEKYNRSNFMASHEVNSGKLEIDILVSDWDLFAPINGFMYSYIQPMDIMRPDLLALRLYGRQDYWWIVSKFNNIDDWWNDCYIGMTLKIPMPIDIENFYLSVKSRENKKGNV